LSSPSLAGGQNGKSGEREDAHQSVSSYFRRRNRTSATAPMPRVSNPRDAGSGTLAPAQALLAVRTAQATNTRMRMTQSPESPAPRREPSNRERRRHGLAFLNELASCARSLPRRRDRGAKPLSPLRKNGLLDGERGRQGPLASYLALCTATNVDSCADFSSASFVVRSDRAGGSIRSDMSSGTPAVFQVAVAPSVACP
jgi:hypothetical protein